MKTLTLKNPILIDGQQIKDIKYDPSKATATEFLNASKRRTAPSGAEFVLPQNDSAYMFELGIEVLLCSNRDKGWTREDFSRIGGPDIMDILTIGVLFFQETPGEQPQNSSEGQ